MAVKSSDFLSFNDGICEIYSVENNADPGDRPEEKLIQKYKLRFQYHSVGMSRFFEALQTKVKISNVIYCPFREDVNDQDVAIIEGRQYRIEHKQRKDTRPISMLLSLSDIEEAYEL